MKPIEVWEDSLDRSKRIEDLARAMFEADIEYGTGFYSTQKWKDAYSALAKELGFDFSL